MAIIKNPVTIVKSGGGGETPLYEREEGVNFYDYDGTLLYSYSLEEAQELTELPAGPVHTDAPIVFAGWTHTLEQVRTTPILAQVGATYHTSIANGRASIIRTASTMSSYTLKFSQNVDSGVEIDWGDGSTPERISGTGTVTASHTYSSIATTTSSDGFLTIIITPDEGTTLELGGGSLSSPFVAYYAISEVYLGKCSANPFAFSAPGNTPSPSHLRKAMISPEVSSVAQAFNYCSWLQALVIPSNPFNFQGACSYCSGLKKIIAPRGYTNTPAYMVTYNTGLTEAIAGNDVSGRAFESCVSLKRVIIPTTTQRLSTDAFQSSIIDRIVFEDRTAIPSAFTPAWGRTTGSIIRALDFSHFSSVPTLASAANFFDTLRPYTKIVVPDSLYESWIVASGWSDYASQTVKASEYVG